VKFFRKLFDSEVLIHFPHPLPVNREAKDMYQQPNLYKQRRGDGNWFSLEKESKKLKEGTTEGRGNAGGSPESDSPSSELSFEALDEAE
jgi:hypothetical protein